MAIQCPKCGSETRLRTRSKDKQKFYICARYPECKGKISYEETLDETLYGDSSSNNIKEEPVRRAHLRIELKGKANRSVIVEGGTVKIIKESGMFSSAREKALPIRQITSVEVKKPGAVWAGFIQFSIAGGVARDSAVTVTGGSFGAAQDENSVLFADEESYQTALRIKEYIENYSESSAPPTRVQDSSVADEIRKLKALVDEGILTEEEFNRKKQQLLGA